MRDGGLKGIFYKHLPQVHWQSIETGSTGRGIPDLNGCYEGIEAWLELKIQTGKRVLMRPEQIAWIERRTRAKGRVFIAIRTFNDHLYLVAGKDVRRLLEGIPPSPFWALRGCNWEEVIQTIFFSHM